MRGRNFSIFIVTLFFSLSVFINPIFAGYKPKIGTGEWWLEISREAQAAYVGGVIDGFDSAGMYWVGRCAHGQDYMELRNTILKYLKKIPEDRRYQMVGVIIIALSEVCGDRKQRK
ncbi:MAG: hypothetical protein ACE5EN_00140 [Nitrospinota bacterium]